MKHIVYKTTNLVNGKYYIGKHSCNCSPCTYLGSGKDFKKALKEYGKENFHMKILSEFDNADDAYKYESKIVTQNVVNQEDCYNKVCGGKGCLTPELSGTNKECTINGVTYISQKAAAKDLGLSKGTINRWMTGVSKKGRRSKQNRNPVITPYGKFKTIRLAAEAEGINIATLTSRIYSVSNKDYYRCEDHEQIKINGMFF